MCVTPASEIVTPAIPMPPSHGPCFRLQYVIEPGYDEFVEVDSVYVAHDDEIRPRAWGELEMAFACEHLQLGERERHLDQLNIPVMAKLASSMWVPAAQPSRQTLPCWPALLGAFGSL